MATAFRIAAPGEIARFIAYLLLGLPLGTFYFVFLVTGLALGATTVITWIGIPLLIGTLMGAWALCEFERLLARGFLGVHVPAVTRRSQASGLLQRLKVTLTDRPTWIGVAYLLLRFPTGLASFVGTVVLLAVSLAFLTAPLYYQFADLIIYDEARIDTLPEALGLSAAGLVLTVLSLMVIAWAGRVSGQFTRAMLSAR